MRKEREKGNKGKTGSETKKKPFKHFLRSLRRRLYPYYLEFFDFFAFFLFLFRFKTVTNCQLCWVSRVLHWHLWPWSRLPVRMSIHTVRLPEPARIPQVLGPYVYSMDVWILWWNKIFWGTVGEAVHTVRFSVNCPLFSLSKQIWLASSSLAHHTPKRSLRL